MEWTRLTVNLDPALAERAKARAAAERRSFAGYVTVLIEEDLRSNAPDLIAAEPKQEAYNSEPAQAKALIAEAKRVLKQKTTGPGRASSSVRK